MRKYRLPKKSYSIRKFLNLFEFYKSTLPVSLAIAIIPYLHSGTAGFLFAFSTVGLLLNGLIKEVSRKNEYVFYYNNGISFRQLWFFSFAINLIVGLGIVATLIIVEKL